MSQHQQPPGPAPVFRAILWMMGTLASFLIMAMAARQLYQDLSTYHILFYRSVMAVLLLSIIAHRSGWLQIRQARHRVHLGRNLAHFTGQFCWFYGISVLPLAEVFAIEFTTPIWVAILAFFFLGEPMTRARLIAVGMGFLGILVILRPGAGVISPDALVVLVAALGFAISLTVTKYLSRTDSVLSILFFMSLTQTPLALSMCLFDWRWPSAANMPALIIVALTGLSAHYCMARAFRHADATVVAPMDFLRLPLAALVGYAVYQEALDLWVLSGATVIFIGNFLGIRAERKRAMS